MASKAEIVAQYLPAVLEPLERAEAFAPSNIALCKYWGKRDKGLNLPVNSSLSISLGELGSHTVISAAEQDSVSLNGQPLDVADSFAQKVLAFVSLFRQGKGGALAIDTVNTIPTAAGLASSASGFAALTLALNNYYQLDLPKPVLSAFARMGSGSASRSVYTGFVEWQMGVRDDGMDSCASQLPQQWPDLRVGLLKVDTGPKAVDSRSGMQRTVETASLYQSWPAQAAQDLIRLQQAIAAFDFTALGSVAEHNAMSMHATMIASWPPLVYWQAESLLAMQRIWQLREQGLPVYFTMDAGPNLKLLFEKQHQEELCKEFAGLEVIAPFSEL